MPTDKPLHIFEKKSETVMLLSGMCILISVFVVWSIGDFVFWTFAKFLYALGVVLILFDR